MKHLEQFDWYGPHQQWLETNSRKGARANLSGAHLSGANLFGAGVPVMPVRKLTVEGPEVGEPVLVETPIGQTTATWLGVVSSPREMFQAMQLAASMEAERKVGDQR